MIRNDNLLHENLGGYRITAEYSSSVFSTTYLGESTSATTPGQRALIKVLSMAGAPTQQKRQDILQKISFLQQLHHPHILPILSVGEHNGATYIITEYLTSESLFDRLHSRTIGHAMEMEEALIILAQVGRALQYAHRQQVIHGYLEPQSVLFNAQDEVLVTGFHRHVLQLPDTKEDTGPLELSIYRAPELSIGQADAKSDQYSLGCIAYDMFTGYRAFMIPSVNIPGTFYKTRSLIAPGRLNPALPPYIEEAILKAMAKEPEQRYHDISAFLAALKVSPLTGTRDMKKTVTLPQVTAGEIAGMPFTPIPEAATFADVKKYGPLHEITTKDDKEINFDVLAQLLPEILERTEPVTPAHPVLLDVSSGYMSQQDEISFKIHMPYPITDPVTDPVTIKPPLRTTKEERARSKSQRVLIILMCLIAIMLLFATIMMALDLVKSSQKTGPSSSTAATSVANSSLSTHVPGSTATQSGSSSSPAPYQGQGSGPGGHAPNPTGGNGGFLQGITSISPSQIQIWFLPNGWTSGYMFLHYTMIGQVQQNVPMSYNSSASQWQYTISGLSPAQTLIYWFTYQQGSMPYTSGTYTYTVDGGTLPTPVPQPNPIPNPTPIPTPIPTPVPTPIPTSNGCASAFSEQAVSINSSQGLFSFSSCGWTATYVILHYIGAGVVQQNVYMAYSSNAGQWQYTVSGLNSRQTITYWFTYMKNGTQYDSATYTWAHPGR